MAFPLFLEIPEVQMMATQEHDDGYGRNEPDENSAGGK